jgi:hypothetical protein
MPHGDVETVHHDGQWWNRVEGTDEEHGPHHTKQEAVEEGRDLARAFKSEHIIKGLDGRIHERSTYGHDPRDIPG